MYLFRLVALAAVVAAALAAPLAAQGIPTRRPRVTTTANAPRLMVANPFAFAPADSAPAVGSGPACVKR